MVVPSQNWKHARRSASWVAWALCLCAVSLGSTATAGENRLDWSTEDRFEGFLTWNAGKGAIEWDPRATSEDPAGPPPGPDAQTAEAGHYAANCARHWASRNAFFGLPGQRIENPLPIPPDEFESEALPKALWLNASAMIVVNLYVKVTRPVSLSCSDYTLDIELTANGKFLAGGVYRGGTSYDAVGMGRKYDVGSDVPNRGKVKDLPLLSFHMHPEMDVLPAGAKLKLTVFHRSQEGGLRFGAAVDHRSLVSLPFFNDYEVARRAVGPQAAPSPSPPAASPGSAVFALFAMAALGSAPKGKARPLLVAALLSGGCISPQGSSAEAEAATAGQASNTVIPKGGGVGGGTVGELAGSVHDQDLVALPDVHVSLLNADNFTDTDRHGFFSFPALPPGIYQLRFERSGYRTFRHTAEVQPNNITRIDVTLFLVESKENTGVRHRHDYWDRQDSVPIVDQEVEGDVTSSLYGTGLGATSSSVPLLVDIPAGKRIIPGTYDVEVRISWTPHDDSQRLGFAFRANNDPTETNLTYLYPRTSGTPFHIRSTWEMSDAGHQTMTTWSVATWTVPESTWAQRSDSQGPISYDVKITLHRGVLPLEEPHPNPWGDGTALVVLQEETYPSPFGSYGKFFADSLVPPETLWMEAKVRRLGDSRGPGKDAYTIAYTGADWPRNDYAHAVEVADPGTPVGEDTWSFKFAIPSNATDPFYAKISNFRTAVADKMSGQPSEVDGFIQSLLWTADIFTGYAGIEQSKSYQLNLTVIAHRDPMPK